MVTYLMVTTAKSDQNITEGTPRMVASLSPSPPSWRKVSRIA